MNRGAALTGALLVTLATPVTWPLALAAFLLRGGILLVTLPIVVLPTPVGLGNVLAPSITAIALGSMPIAAIAVASAVAVAGLAWLLFAGWLAAALEAEGARIVARDEVEVVIRSTSGTARPATGPAVPVTPGVGEPRIAARILVARLIAYVPLGLAVALGAIRMVSVTYRELILPSDATTSIVLRVLRAAPEVLVAVVVAWMVGEIVGAVAARRITLAGDPVVAALRHAVVTSVRHPVAALARFWLPTAALVVVLAPSALAAASAWAAVGAVLAERVDPFAVGTAVVLFVVLWVIGLFLAAVVCAWRAAVWTVAEVLGQGTFGGSSGSRPGDCQVDGSSVTL
jgi:hypothetical protein